MKYSIVNSLVEQKHFGNVIVGEAFATVSHRNYLKITVSRGLDLDTNVIVDFSDNALVVKIFHNTEIILKD